MDNRKTNILAIDCSTNVICIAIRLNDKLYSNKLNYLNSCSLITEIDKLIEHKNLKNLDYILLGIGPGSFTSIKLATSVCQSIAMAFDKKIVTISSLLLIAYSNYQYFKNNVNTNVIIMKRANSKCIYFGNYNFLNGIEILEENSILIENMQEKIRDVSSLILVDDLVIKMLSNKKKTLTKITSSINIMQAIKLFDNYSKIFQQYYYAESIKINYLLNSL